MAIDQSKSFEVSEHGISFDGGVHASSGSAVPTHTATQGSWYWREGTNEVYQNQDGATDWQLFESGGGSGSASTETFTKVGHGLAVGDVVRHSGANPEDFITAQADTSDNAEAVGIISAVAGNDFTITYSGKITGLTGLTLDNVHYLSDSVAGGLTVTEPNISKPMLYAISATEGIVYTLRAVESGDPLPDKIFRDSRTYNITGEIKVASGDTDFLIPFPIRLADGETCFLKEVTHFINSGTSVTYKVQVNGSDATGFTGLSATTTMSTVTPSQIQLSHNDKVAIVVTAIAGVPKNLSVTISMDKVN